MNGELHNTKTGDGCGTISENIGDLVLGKLYTGFLDDIIIFKKVLNKDEVLQLYKVEPCCQ